MILRRLHLHSLPLNRCHPRIFSWFNIQIHRLLARLLEIHLVDSTLDLIGFTNSDWAGDKIDRNSTSDYSLSLVFGSIYWPRKKQDAIALSSTEAEYRGVVNITIQDMWLQHFLTELGIQFHQTIIIWCDNQRTLKFYRDPIQRQQTKHIEIHIHYIRDLVQEVIIDL
jgi:hypothetical protein